MDCAIAWLAEVGGSTWAAWVQAIGSIGAIYAAVKVVDRQHRLEVMRARRQEHEREVAKHESFAQLVGGAAQIARKVAVWAEEHRRRNVPTVDLGEVYLIESEVEAMWLVLRSVDPLAFERHIAIESLNVAAASMRRINNSIQLLRGTGPWMTIGRLEGIAAEAANLLEPRARDLFAAIEKLKATALPMHI